ncbi:hypothetical protein DL764_010013 [Monosporascus ibericus]|uniref:Uncharacterized protein n=1 Tax=Monosporascus ibericus TaxID=155417 RepID=A0A4Q4SVV4_9PEZI|nr:hypothetical protein DL764_010013 [Monosporascus ibericus]
MLQLTAAPRPGPEKLAAVTDLINRLRQDLADGSLPSQQTITRHSFDSGSSTTSRNALRCLCNALLLKPETRQTFVDLGYEAKACSKLRNDNRDDEFLVSRVLFLTTYGTDANLAELIGKHQLADAIVENLGRHAERHTTSRQTNDPMEHMALIETLKLLFNITYYCKDRVSSFTPVIPYIVALLCDSTFQPAKPLDPPIGSLINALLNLDLEMQEARSSFYPENEPKLLSDRLLDLLVRSTAAYSDEELETAVPALVGVIRAVHEYAPDEVKTSIRNRLLPTEADRNEVLGRSGSTPSWLLKNSTNPLTPSLRDTISDLLFDMSDRNASTFINNVGYGFASGYLFNKNLIVPQDAVGPSSNAEGSTSRPVNPVTGQFLDKERHPDAPEMTDAEKEREAERLFVLFERLRANGMISVENPVRTAVQEGRLEELPDDYQEDVD